MMRDEVKLSANDESRMTNDDLNNNSAFAAGGLHNG